MILCVSFHDFNPVVIHFPKTRRDPIFCSYPRGKSTSFVLLIHVPVLPFIEIIAILSVNSSFTYLPPVTDLLFNYRILIISFNKIRLHFPFPKNPM